MKDWLVPFTPPETPINTGDFEGMMKGEGFCVIHFYKY